MKLRCENFPHVLHTKKPKGLKRLECWSGFIMGNPHTHTHTSPYRRGHPDISIFAKSLKNTLVMKVSVSLKSFVMIDY